MSDAPAEEWVVTGSQVSIDLSGTSAQPQHRRAEGVLESCPDVPLTSRRAQCLPRRSPERAAYSSTQVAK